MQEMDSFGSTLMSFGLVLPAVILVTLWTLLPLLLWSQLRQLRDELRRLNGTVAQIKDDTAGMARLVENTRLLPHALQDRRSEGDDRKPAIPVV